MNVVYSLLVAPAAGGNEPVAVEVDEWQLPTPVPVHDFEQLPVFDADPYPYGVEPAGVPALRPAPATGAP